MLLLCSAKSFQQSNWSSGSFLWRFIIHQIFSLACDWSKRVTWANIPQLKLGKIRGYSPIFKTARVAKKIWRIINTIASIWSENVTVRIFVLGHWSVPRSSQFSSSYALGKLFVTRNISASKHGGQLVNEFFICLEDNTLSPGYLKGWRIFKMTAVIQKFFQNSCSRQFRIVNAVVTSPASRSDRLTELCFSPN